MGALPQLVPNGQPYRLGQRSYRAHVAYVSEYDTWLFPSISCKLEGEKEKLALALKFVKKNGELPERQPQLLRPLTHPVYLLGKDLDGACAASLLMIA